MDFKSNGLRIVSGVENSIWKEITKTLDVRIIISILVVLVFVAFVGGYKFGWNMHKDYINHSDD